jgi:hypothetical protein
MGGFWSCKSVDLFYCANKDNPMKGVAKFSSWNTVSSRIAGISFAAVVLIGAALFTAQISLGGDESTTPSKSAQDLIKTLEGMDARLVTRDTNGTVVALSVPCDHFTEAEVSATSELHSLKKLTLIGWSGNWALYKSPARVANLDELTNLVTLNFRCFTKNGLEPGVLNQVSKMTQLRELSLYYSRPPTDEYYSITNLINLRVLRIFPDEKFGDKELLVIRSLTNLNELRLDDTGVTRVGTKFLSFRRNLTNLVIRYKDPPER